MTKKHEKPANTPASGHPALADAPKDVQLAVDLIYLLETNEIDSEVALSALEIVKNDLLTKMKQHQ